MEDVETEITSLSGALRALLGGELSRLVAAFNSYMAFLLISIVRLGVMGQETGASLESLKRADDKIDAARVKAELLNDVETDSGDQDSEGNGQHSLDGRADTAIPAASTDPESSDVLARGDGPSTVGKQAKRDNKQATTVSPETEDPEDPAISRPSLESVQSSLRLQVARTTNHEEQLSLLHRQVNDLREMSGRLDISQAKLRTKIEATKDLLEKENKMKSELEREEKQANDKKNEGWFTWCVIL